MNERDKGRNQMKQRQILGRAEERSTSINKIDDDKKEGVTYSL